MKTPDFWYKQKPNFLTKVIFCPVTFLYNLLSILFHKFFAKEEKLPGKHFLIGNLVVGGAGKTPFALFLYKFLRDELKIDEDKICIIAHSYKANVNEISKLSSDSDPTKFGDESLLLAKSANIFVGKKRNEIAKYAYELGYRYFIYDDGLQSRNIIFDQKFIIIDEKYLFGNEKLFPLGPLRSSFSITRKYLLENNSALIFISNDILSKERKNFLEDKVKNIFYSLSNIFYCRRELENLDKINGKNIVAFCGLAINEKFFKSLRSKISANSKIIDEISFPNHYQYNKSDIDNIKKIAHEKNAIAVTTSKDFVKINKNDANNIIEIKMKLILHGNKEKLLQIIQDA